MGTWGFVRFALAGGTATLPSTLGLYTMTGLPFGLAALGSRVMRAWRPAAGWLLAVWIVGISASFIVLTGSRGEPLGQIAVFMLPVFYYPALALALLVAWCIRRIARRHADAL